MHLNTLVLMLPALFVMSGILAQSTGVPTSAVPDVTFPDTDAFIFCSDKDCSGTCELTTDLGAAKTAHSAPNSMGFQSMYWYDPGNYNWFLYMCINYYNVEEVVIGPNTCYNLYDNGVPTDFYEYWHVVGPIDL